MERRNSEMIDPHSAHEVSGAYGQNGNSEAKEESASNELVLAGGRGNNSRTKANKRRSNHHPLPSTQAIRNRTSEPGPNHATDSIYLVWGCLAQERGLKYEIRSDWPFHSEEVGAYDSDNEKK